MNHPLQRSSAKLDQQLNYMSTADYHAFAMRQVAEEKRIVEELGLREQ